MRIQVIGGGIIGLSCAAELLDRGHDVYVVDRAPGSGASQVAAGMLAATAEVWPGEADLHRLGVASARLWPSYAASLGVPLHATGTLLVGHDTGDAQLVERQVDLLADLGIHARMLPGPALRTLEPGLSRVRGGARVEDAAVDPRRVVAALLARLGDRVVPGAPPEAPEATVVATGARLPAPFTSLVRGVRGEVLRLRSSDAPTHVLRGWAGGDPVYVVPRPGGELVVGATVEEHDEPPIVTAGGVLRLLRAARALLPVLERAELVAAEARDRPATADHLPLIGPTLQPRTWLAAGHHRNGVLLAPLTARLLADALEGAEPDPAVDPRRFSPERTHPC